MTKLPLIAVAMSAIALAACSGEPAREAEATGEAMQEQAGGSPSETPAQAVNDASIPQALHGRWGLVPADCTSTRGDAKGLMRVGADKLEFYESVASLGPVKQIDADSITAAYEFTGEGQTWILDVTLSTPDGGKTIVREDTGPDAAPNPLIYTKCP